jgi:hypothetical protein
VSGSLHQCLPDKRDTYISLADTFYKPHNDNAVRRFSASLPADNADDN